MNCWQIRCVSPTREIAQISTHFPTKGTAQANSVQYTENIACVCKYLCINFKMKVEQTKYSLKLAIRLHVQIKCIHTGLLAAIASKVTNT